MSIYFYYEIIINLHLNKMYFQNFDFEFKIFFMIVQTATFEFNEKK